MANVKPGKATRHDQGFTLVEVLAAAAILAIALASVLSVEVSSLWGNRLSRNLSNGAQVAANTLEGVHKTSLTAITTGTQATVTIDSVVFTPTLSVTQLTQVSPTMYLVTAKVTWQDDASFLTATPTQHQVEAQMLRSTMESF